MDDLKTSLHYRAFARAAEDGEGEVASAARAVLENAERYLDLSADEYAERFEELVGGGGDQVRQALDKEDLTPDDQAELVMILAYAHTQHQHMMIGGVRSARVMERLSKKVATYKAFENASHMN